MFSPADYPSPPSNRAAAPRVMPTLPQQPGAWYPKQVEITRVRGAESGFPQAEAFIRHPESKNAPLP